MLLNQYWNLTGTSLRMPAVALGHGDLIVLDVWDQPLRALEQFINGVDVGVGKFKPLGLCLRCSSMLTPLALLVVSCLGVGSPGWGSLFTRQQELKQ